ncbi:PhoX family protein [Zavarzinia sp. CC-PAN008]|uniref:PhoX family protein n=1 Tax=Zavarzinia sp. CC-PAN008 TaxID=3243332 RepID=UPI003F74AC3E
MSECEREDLSLRGRSEAETFESVMDTFLSRRTVLTGAGLGVAAAGLAGAGTLGMLQAPPAEAATARFTSVPENTDDRVTVPPGYTATALLAWGEPLFPGDVAWGYGRDAQGRALVNHTNMTAAQQARRVGFNHDMLALFPNPFGAPAKVANRFPWPTYIAAFNHEYTSGATMFPGFTGVPTKAQADLQMQAVGFTFAGIRLLNAVWTHDKAMRVNNVATAPYVARRVTLTTPCEFTGPARGHPWLGTTAIGTYNNCAGGFTPWGTYLSAEENFDGLFSGASSVTNPLIQFDHKTVHGIGDATADNLGFNPGYFLYYPRFNLRNASSVTEPFKFGWVVETDAYSPTSTPKKRTALGRFKHEAAQVVIAYPTATARTGQAVVYTGDDQRFDYAYKFVSSGTFNLDNPRAAAHFSLLDTGTLYVAKFKADGTGEWLPVTFANVNAKAPGKFSSQADVLIRCRQAADALGATPMDRPEDIKMPRDASFRGNGKVFIALTNNSNRKAAGDTGSAGRGRPAGSAAADAANPRGPNPAGHIIEITEAGNDYRATRFTWDIFLLAGDPALPAGDVRAVINPRTNRRLLQGDRFGAPDNLAFDNDKNLWIATDGNPSNFECNDQVLATIDRGGATPVETRRFLTGPAACEVCGPIFSPDNTTFFCNIQHPGEDGVLDEVSSWPDNRPKGTGVPRPAMVAVRRNDGGLIGT